MISWLILAVALSSAASPSAQPTQAACAIPFQEATITKSVAPNYPDSERRENLGPVTVLVDVVIKPDGTIASEEIRKSSNDVPIDLAALRAAKESQYAPKVLNCQPVMGNFIYRADFNPGPR